MRGDLKLVILSWLIVHYHFRRRPLHNTGRNVDAAAGLLFPALLHPQASVFTIEFCCAHLPQTANTVGSSSDLFSFTHFFSDSLLSLFYSHGLNLLTSCWTQ